MNQADCKRLIESYVDWLRGGLTVDTQDSVCELTTPFLDRHNDHLQIYAVERNGKIALSDDGYILSDLKSGGVDVNSPKRKIILEAILRGFNVQNADGEIRVEASPDDLGWRIHALVQAMLSVNDMFVLAQPHVASLFVEDVKSFFDEQGIRYKRREKIPGRSGYNHVIDFLIPKSNGHPDRIVKAVNYPDKNAITKYLFTVGEVREAKKNGTLAYALLNDVHEVTGDTINALKEYDVTSVLWSGRDEYISEWAA